MVLQRHPRGSIQALTHIPAHQQRAALFHSTPPLQRKRHNHWDSRGSNHTSRRFRRVQAKHGVMNSINDYAESLFQMCSENGAGPKRDELNFEFLGNKTGEPYLTKTNVYKNRTGGREMRHMLWFDPIEDYHTYSILWNNHQVV
ncbi:hypothetical protein JHK82_043181 [Glycine max]|nr:hypothetical protein JHK85_043853 [Glycine max]KAG5106211.1 hypothetical protein JHK82_043181 [Glycine max]